MSKRELTEAADGVVVALARCDSRKLSASIDRLYALIEAWDESTANVLKMERSQAALALAIRDDLPVPLSFYSPWCSQSTLRNLAMVDGRLQWESIGAFKHLGKLLLAPSKFKAAMKRHNPNFTYND